MTAKDACVACGSADTVSYWAKEPKPTSTYDLVMRQYYGDDLVMRQYYGDARVCVDCGVVMPTPPVKFPNLKDLKVAK